MRYPLFLDLAGRRVVVVGGGRVAARRCRALVEAGAEVTVIAPELSAELSDELSDELSAELSAEVAAVEQLTVVRRRFQADDLDGAWLVLACTDDAEVNESVARAAAERRIWCSRADDAGASAAWVPATGAVGDVQVAVTGGGDPGRATAVRDAAVQALQSGHWPARRTRRGDGRVVLVGGGPGDPGLLTLRGHRALLDADVVVADRLGPSGLLASLPSDVEVVDVGKNPRGPAASQDDINELLVARARAGQTVVRLKGGDPFVLGRGSEEVEACTAAGVVVDVIPGVSSATAAATLAGVPLTRRGTAQQFTVVSGHVPPGDPRSTVDWTALGAGTATLVLLMAVANLRPITDALTTAGRRPTTPAVVIENASLPHQRIVRTTLGDLADTAAAHSVVPPAIVVIGDVAASDD